MKLLILSWCQSQHDCRCWAKCAKYLSLALYCYCLASSGWAICERSSQKWNKSSLCIWWKIRNIWKREKLKLSLRIIPNALWNGDKGHLKKEFWTNRSFTWKHGKKVIFDLLPNRSACYQRPSWCCWTLSIFKWDRIDKKKCGSENVCLSNPLKHAHFFQLFFLLFVPLPVFSLRSNLNKLKCCCLLYSCLFSLPFFPNK